MFIPKWVHCRCSVTESQIRSEKLEILNHLAHWCCVANSWLYANHIGIQERDNMDTWKFLSVKLVGDSGMCKINKRNKEKYANTNTKTAWIAFGIHFSFARAFDFPIFFSSIFFRAFGFNRRMILLCRHFTQRIASPPNKYRATYEMTIYSYFYVLMISYRVCGEVIWCI